MFYIDNDIETEVRYDPIKFFNFDEDNIDIFNSFIMDNIKNLPEQGTYTITVPQKRPDMLSYNIYGDTQYWFLLMWYNSLLSIDQLVTGLEIKYFNLSQLEDLYMQASKYQKVGA